ncbi:TRAP transporter small permease [Virgibacillus sp. W0181]|uniref:TRAP transporter small permease n=1 Tax=Virgibacillus sp. W0181 TaxID=3391581 RepID=UPI003F448F51
MIDKFISIVRIITNILMALLTMIVSFEVISRYFLNTPVKQTSELAAIVFPWMAFLAAIIVTKDNGHFAVSYFRNFLPKKMQVVSIFITKLIMLYFSVYMIISSVQLFNISASQRLPVLQISKAWLHYSITAAFIGITLVIVYQLYLMIVKKDLALEEE